MQDGDELCDIYGSQTVYDDIDLIEDAVEGICDEEKVTWYTNVSRIKRKITDKLGKRAAEHYIIKRETDGLYRIGASLLTIEGRQTYALLLSNYAHSPSLISVVRRGMYSHSAATLRTCNIYYCHPFSLDSYFRHLLPLDIYIHLDSNKSLSQHN